MTNKKRCSIERVKEIAAEEFARQPLECVSMNEIAAKAHCSTATIYQVFGSKEQLYKIAVQANLALTPFPEMKHHRDVRGNALGPLINFLEKRVHILSDPDHTTIQRLISANITVLGEIVTPIKNRVLQTTTSSIAKEVKKAVDAGLMRDIDVSSATYVLLACTAYEPLVRGLFSSDNRGAVAAEVLRKAFLPLLTDAGLKAYEDYTNPGKVRVADDFPTSTSH